MVVSLASDNPALRVPATVTVHQGALRASFTATSLPSASGAIVVTASFHGTSSTTTLTMTAPSTGAPKLTALSCTPKTLRPGTSGICRVSLHAAPGGAGAEVRLSTSNASLQVPATVRTRPGQSTLDFQVDAIGSGEGIVVQASLGPDMVQETLSVAWDRSEPIRVPGPQFAKSGAELRFQVSAQDPAATLSAGALPAGAYFDSNAREFRWTPAGTQIGAYSLNFMVIDSAGRETTARVSVQVESGDPVVTRIVNAASRSRDAACSPGAIAAIEGRWLTDGTTVSDAETKVWANGAVVPILAASDTELNILCPDAIAGGEVQFVVQTGHGLSDPLTTTARSAAPGIFSLDGSGNGQGWVLLKDTAGLAMVRNRRLEGQPAIPGDQVLLYATGIDRLANISVQIAEFQVTPAAIDAVPRHPGLFQVAVAVPDVGADNGEVPVSLFGDAPDGSSLHCNVVRMAVEGGIR
jgi:uncharacterized protein (TIGR03437 family)